MECKICFDRYNYSERKPMILLPCGHTFCDSCLKPLNQCPKCRLQIEKKIQNWEILEDFTDNNSSVNENDNILDLKLKAFLLNDIESSKKMLKKAHENKLNECIRLIETLKLKINQEEALRITDIKKEYENQRNQLEKEHLKLTTKINDMNELNKNKIDEAINLISIKINNDFDFNQMENLKKQSVNAQNLLKENIISLENFKLNFEFEKNILDSSLIILDDEHQSNLMNLCCFPLNQKWKLIYRATRDGFKGTDFSLKCINKPNTLVIIKSNNGNIFGGYTEKNWSLAIPKLDKNAFIFSFINKKNTPLKILCADQTNSILGRNELALFEFGCGPDLFISNDSNVNIDSYSNLGFTYKHEKFSYQSQEKLGSTILADSYHFNVVEIEVFTKK